MQNHSETCMCRECMWDEVRQDVLSRHEWNRQVVEAIGDGDPIPVYDLHHAEMMEGTYMRRP